MNRLYLPVPGILVRVHHIKTLAGQPPGRRGKPQLVDPSGFNKRCGNAVVNNTWPLVINVLRKNVHLVPLRQLLYQRYGITLCTTTGRFEDPVQDRNPERLTIHGERHSLAGALFTKEQYRIVPAPSPPHFVVKPACQ